MTSNVTKQNIKPSFIPSPSPFATPNAINKTNIKVKTITRINRTEILKTAEPSPKLKVNLQERQATNYIEICIILFIVFIIYRYCKKIPVKNTRYNQGLPIHTPPSSPDNKRNSEVYYAFHPNTSSIYRRSNSSNSLT